MMLEQALFDIIKQRDNEREVKQKVEQKGLFSG